MGGYDTAAGGATQGDSTVGVVDSNGDVNTTTTTSLLSGNNTRGAASADGTKRLCRRRQRCRGRDDGDEHGRHAR